MTDWLARAQLVAAGLCRKYRQIDSVLADNEAHEAAMLYELCPKLRKWNFDGWVCHRIWVAHLLRKQNKAPADSSGAQNTEGNMPRGNRLTEETRQHIIENIKRGMKQNDIAVKYGVSLSTVSKLSGGMVRHKISDDIRQAISADIAAGMSTYKAAEKYGVGETTARRIAAAVCPDGPDAQGCSGGFVFAESMTREQRAQYTAGVIAEVEGAAPRCENAAETRETLPKSSAMAEGDPGPGGLTVKQLIRLHWTDDILYFYEYEPGVKDGKWDFSGTELFLAYHSSVCVESMLLPEVLERTVCRIYNDDGVIRILVDRQEGIDL